jgi:ABC-type Fe3+-siderophore transport system permease subunit
VDPNEDPRIEELLRSTRRKKAIAFAVIGAFVVFAGVIMLGLLLQQNVDPNNAGGSRSGGGYQLMIVAGGGVVVGIGCLIAAVRTVRERS